MTIAPLTSHNWIGFQSPASVSTNHMPHSQRLAIVAWGMAEVKKD